MFDGYRKKPKTKSLLHDVTAFDTGGRDTFVHILDIRVLFETGTLRILI